MIGITQTLIFESMSPVCHFLSGPCLSYLSTHCQHWASSAEEYSSDDLRPKSCLLAPLCSSNCTSSWWSVCLWGSPCHRSELNLRCWRIRDGWHGLGYLLSKLVHSLYNCSSLILDVSLPSLIKPNVEYSAWHK